MQFIDDIQLSITRSNLLPACARSSSWYEQYCLNMVNVIYGTTGGSTRCSIRPVKATIVSGVPPTAAHHTSVGQSIHTVNVNFLPFILNLRYYVKSLWIHMNIILLPQISLFFPDYFCCFSSDTLRIVNIRDFFLRHLMEKDTRHT